MWQKRAQQEVMQRFGDRVFPPALSRLQMNGVLKFESENFYNLAHDFSQVSSNIRSTMELLTSRNMEVSRWQAHMFDTIGQVGREITAVEMMKDMAECCLQERQLYSPMMSECVALSSSVRSATLRSDQVFTELRKDEQLTNESREWLQNQIRILLEKQNSLMEIRSQLQADYQDKDEAVKLINKCITFEVNSNCCSGPPVAPYKLSHVSHDKWMSHSKELKLMADKLIRESSSFRSSLHLSLSKLKISQERQRCIAKDSLRRKIHELNRVRETLMWDIQQVKREISDLTKENQNVVGQIRNCETKMHLTTHRIDILNQRPRYELCLDHPLISLTMERQDLAKLAGGLHMVLKHTEQKLKIAQGHLMLLEDKLAKNAHVLQVEQKCQDIYQGFQLSHDPAVIFAHKPRQIQHLNLPAVE